MGPGRSSSLRIGGDTSAVAGSGWTGGVFDRLARVELQDAPGAPPFPLDKGKGRIDLIKYPGGSEYLKSAVQHALVVGPNKSVLHMGPLLSDVTDLLLAFEFGPLMF